MVKSSYEGIPVLSEPAVLVVGDAKWPEGEERRGWRWRCIFCASEMAFSRMKRCLLEKKAGVLVEGGVGLQGG